MVKVNVSLLKLRFELLLLSHIGLLCIRSPEGADFAATAVNPLLMSSNSPIEEEEKLYNTKDNTDEEILDRVPLISYCVSSQFALRARSHPSAFTLLQSLLIKVFFISSLVYAVLPSAISIIASRFRDKYLVLSLCATISSIVDPLLRLAAGNDFFRNSVKFVDSAYMVCMLFAVTLFSLLFVSPNTEFSDGKLNILIPVFNYLIVMGLCNFLTTLLMLRVLSTHTYTHSVTHTQSHTPSHTHIHTCAYTDTHAEHAHAHTYA